MAGVVNELVDVGVAAEHRRGALVEADEVQQDQCQEGGASEPGCGGQGRGQRTDRHAGLMSRHSTVPFGASRDPVRFRMLLAQHLTHTQAFTSRVHSGASVLGLHQIPVRQAQTDDKPPPIRSGRAWATLI